MNRKRILAAGLSLGVVAIIAMILSTSLTGVSTDDAAGETALLSRSDVGQSSSLGNDIAVQGHWTLQVVEPDGTYADRFEFDNRFTGRNALVELMSREYSAGIWYVRLTPPDGQDSPRDVRRRASVSSTLDYCSTTEASSTGTVKLDVRLKNLTISPTTSGDGFAKVFLELKGSITAIADGKIGSVSSGLTLCPASTSPELCGGGAGAITARNISTASITPIDMVAGQSMLVTVKLSFPSTVIIN